MNVSPSNCECASMSAESLDMTEPLVAHKQADQFLNANEHVESFKTTKPCISLGETNDSTCPVQPLPPHDRKRERERERESARRRRMEKGWLGAGGGGRQNSSFSKPLKNLVISQLFGPTRVAKHRSPSCLALARSPAVLLLVFCTKIAQFHQTCPLPRKFGFAEKSLCEKMFLVPSPKGAVSTQEVV